MSAYTQEQLKDALTEAGIEVYRVTDEAIEIAERVRYHIMDSGIRVVAAPLSVRFTIRSQQSDFPRASESELFEKVRALAAQATTLRGYAEADAEIVPVTDPVDSAKVLDVWHELSFVRTIERLSDLVDEVRWALGIEKYVTE